MDIDAYIDQLFENGATEEDVADLFSKALNAASKRKKEKNVNLALGQLYVDMANALNQFFKQTGVSDHTTPDEVKHMMDNTIGALAQL